MLGDYAKTSGDVSDSGANKGRFDRAAEVSALPRSPSKYIFSPHFVSRGFDSLRSVRRRRRSVHGRTEGLRRENTDFTGPLMEAQ